MWFTEAAATTILFRLVAWSRSLRSGLRRTCPCRRSPAPCSTTGSPWRPTPGCCSTRRAPAKPCTRSRSSQTYSSRTPRCQVSYHQRNLVLDIRFCYGVPQHPFSYTASDISTPAHIFSISQWSLDKYSFFKRQTITI